MVLLLFLEAFNFIQPTPSNSGSDLSLSASMDMDEPRCDQKPWVENGTLSSGMLSAGPL